MSSTTIPLLPAEIIDEIIDYLESQALCRLKRRSEHRKTLASCLFVSSAFRRRALFHLFCRVNISNAVFSQIIPIPSFLDLASTSRQISALRRLIEPPLGSRIGGVGRFIKEVTFGFYCAETRIGPRAPGDYSQIEDILEDEDFVSLVRSLRGEEYGVRKFALCLKKEPLKRINWNEIPTETCAAVQHLIRSPYLTSLTLGGLTFFPFSILRGSCIKNVTLECCLVLYDALEDEAKITDSLSNYPALEGFECQRSYLSRDQRQLRHLTTFSWFIRPMADDPVILQEIVQVSGRTLKSLHIEIPGKLLETFPNLGEMPNLREFHLSIRLPSSYHLGTIDKSFATLMNVPETMEFLENIELCFSIGELQHFTYPLWGTIDAGLSSGQYPALKSGGIHVEFDLWAEFDENGNQYLNVKLMGRQMLRYITQTCHHLSTNPDISFDFSFI